MKDVEKKVVELEVVQKHNSERLDRLHGVVEDMAKSHASHVAENEKRIGALMTVTEVHSQQIGVLVWVARILVGAVLLGVIGAVLGLILKGAG